MCESAKQLPGICFKIQQTLDSYKQKHRIKQNKNKKLQLGALMEKVNIDGFWNSVKTMRDKRWTVLLTGSWNWKGHSFIAQLRKAKLPEYTDQPQLTGLVGNGLRTGFNWSFKYKSCHAMLERPLAHGSSHDSWTRSHLSTTFLEGQYPPAHARNFGKYCPKREREIHTLWSTFQVPGGQLLQNRPRSDVLWPELKLPPLP